MARAGEGAGGMQKWIWMAVAVLLIAGLYGWLALQSQRYHEEVAVREPVDRRAAAENDAAAEEDEYEWVTLDGLSAQPGEFVGDRRIRISNVEVMAPLGPRAFWAMAEDRDMMLVLISPDLQEAPPALSAGDTIHLGGYVAEVNDSAIAEWQQSGIIDPEAVPQLEMARFYLFGTRLVRPRQEQEQE